MHLIDTKTFVTFETWHSFQKTSKIMSYNYFVAQNIKIIDNTERREGKVHPFTGTEALYRPYGS